MFIAGLIVYVLTSALAVYSIFYNYDEEKRVRLSKWGIIAVITAVVLLITNVTIKIIEKKKIAGIENEVARKDHEADSIRRDLLMKSEELNRELKNFKKESSQRLSTIDTGLDSNLRRLELLAVSSEHLGNSLRNSLVIRQGIKDDANRIKGIVDYTLREHRKWDFMFKPTSILIDWEIKMEPYAWRSNSYLHLVIYNMIVAGELEIPLHVPSAI